MRSKRQQRNINDAGKTQTEPDREFDANTLWEGSETRSFPSFPLANLGTVERYVILCKLSFLPLSLMEKMK